MYAYLLGNGVSFPMQCSAALCKSLPYNVASVSEKGTYIQYYIVDANDPDTFAQVYEEVDINNYDEQEALTIAMQYQNKKEEYFGT